MKSAYRDIGPRAARGWRIFSGVLLACFLLAIPGATSTAADERVITFDTFHVEDPVVALTFDVTFDRGDGAEILDTLALHGVKATFAITGIWAQTNPDLMHRIVAEGHDLMNHTWDHASFTGEYTGSGIHQPQAPLTHEQIVRQLKRTEELVEQQVGINMQPYVRPPYGDYDDDSLVAMADAGYHYNIMWTVDTFGWHGRPVTEVQQRALDAARPGANILMHVGHGSTDGAALSGIIAGLRARGYEFATVFDFVEGYLADPDALYLAPSKQIVGEHFVSYWSRNGGLLSFGLPVTRVLEEGGLFVQYFERTRLELVPDYRADPLQVHELPIFADEARAATADPSNALARRDDGRCLSTSSTDIRICGRLKHHWEAYGGFISP